MVNKITFKRILYSHELEKPGRGLNPTLDGEGVTITVLFFFFFKFFRSTCMYHLEHAC